MNIVGIFITLMITLIGINKERKVYGPLTFFSGLWMILMLLASLKFFGLYDSDDLAYVYITIGVASFCAGCLLMNKIRLSDKSSSNIINETVYNVMMILCIFSLIYNIRIIISYIFGHYNISQIYYIMAETNSGEATALSSLYSSWQERLQQYIGYPLLYTLVPISIIGYLNEKKKKYLICSLILCFLRFFIDMRRTFVVIVITYFVILVVIRLGSKEKPKWLTRKLKRRLAIFIFAFIVVFIYLSTVRRDASEVKYSFLYNIYTYYVGSIPYFGQRISLLPSDLHYSFGMTSLRGLFAPIVAVLGLLGIKEPYLMTLATQNIESLHNVVLNITPTHKFNSYATVFFEFYLDGGVMGIIILSFLFGLISFYLFKKCINFNSARDQFRYAYFFSIFLSLSVLHFNGAVVCYIWPFIIERMLFISEKKE